MITNNKTMHGELTMANNKDLLRKTFHCIFEAPDFNEDVIAQFFHQNYTQHVNGKTLDYQDFVKHIITLRNTLYDMKITFLHLIGEGNAVSSVHIAEGSKADGQRIKAKVVAYFEFKNDKLILCDELTHLLEGKKEDQDLGARC